MHWPCSTDPANGRKHVEGWAFTGTWRDMQKLAGVGKVRSIGVSNFGIRNLEILLNHPDTKVRLVGGSLAKTRKSSLPLLHQCNEVEPR